MADDQQHEEEFTKLPPRKGRFPKGVTFSPLDAPIRHSFRDPSLKKVYSLALTQTLARVFHEGKRDAEGKVVEPKEYTLSVSNKRYIMGQMMAACHRCNRWPDVVRRAAELEFRLGCALNGRALNGAPLNLSPAIDVFEVRLLEVARYDVTRDRMIDELRRVDMKDSPRKQVRHAPAARQLVDTEGGEEGVGLGRDDAVFLPEKGPSEMEITELARLYIHEHHLVSSVDQRNAHLLARVQLGLEQGSLDAGEGTLSLKRLQEALGMTREQREDETQRELMTGTLADLLERVETYAFGAFAEREQQWEEEEIALLLRKADRTFPDGTPEMSDDLFSRLTQMTIAHARSRIPDPYDPKYGRRAGGPSGDTSPTDPS